MESTTTTPLTRALDTIKKLRAQLDSQRASQALAIVGVGLRLPGAIDSLDSYWQALRDGRDLVRPMPAARKARFAAEWDALPNKGGFLDEVTGFDAGFFGISPREARALDPQHRLLLEVAWEALEDAALPPDRLRGARTGLYVGITGQDYRDWQPGAPDLYWATGNGHCFAAGRLAYAMGFNGPAIAVDTACSSSLVAVHLASQALRRGECDVALAGGVNLILSPRSTRMVVETRALAPDGVCKAFDARANGFTRGEGSGVVVLKRLDHALRDGDRVHAVLRGSAVNQDGRSSGFTAPNVLAQIALIETALDDAGLSAADIGMIEAHGTGTALGDPIEMEALVAALGRKNGGRRLHVGSVKTNVGHLEAAAGIAGLIKAIACCTRRAIPALVHYRALNPRIDLAGTGIALPTALTAWSPAEGGFAGVSSFGITGTNAHVIVGPVDAAAAPAACAARGFEISARTPEALRSLAARFRTRLAELPADQYGAFAYTATAGRARHAVCAQVAAADREAALAALDAIAAGAASAAVAIGSAADADPAFGELPRRVVGLPHYPWQREEFVPEAPASAAASQRSAASVRELVRGHVAATLGHRDASAVSDDACLFDLGLDSLMAVDLARALSRRFSIELAIGDVFEHPSVAQLAARAIAAGASAPSAAAPEVSAPVLAPVAQAEHRTAAPRAPRVAFLFACQGGQYFGMGRELYETEPVFRAKIDACDRILAPMLGASLVDLMMRGDDKDAIHQTCVTQPALVALELALADLWTSRGIAAAAVMGHSFGEIAAAIHAGVMDLPSGLALVAHRARLMQSTAHGAMLAVSASLARVTAWLAGTGLDVAAVNGPESVVVSGATDAIDALIARLAADGVASHRLAVSHASHSRLMDPVLPAMREAIAELAFRAPALPIVANLTGRLAAPGDYDAEYWCRHLREPVQFVDGARALHALDIDVYLEIGPGCTLVKLVEAAGLLPTGGGVASLRRGASDRASLRGADEKLVGPAPVRAPAATDPVSPALAASPARPGRARLERAGQAARHRLAGCRATARRQCVQRSPARRTGAEEAQ